MRVRVHLNPDGNIPEFYTAYSSFVVMNIGGEPTLPILDVPEDRLGGLMSDPCVASAVPETPVQRNERP